MAGNRSRRQNGGRAVAALLLSAMVLGTDSGAAYAAQGTAIESETSSSIMDEALTKEQADKIVDFIVEKIGEGGLDSEETLRDAIAEGEEEFQITLTEEEKDKIVQVVNQIKTWGLDAEGLAKKAKELYDEYGLDLLEHPEQAAAKAVKNSISDSMKGIGKFFSGVGNGIKNFFSGIFG